jgi:hypothetical protein
VFSKTHPESTFSKEPLQPATHLPYKANRMPPVRLQDKKIKVMYIQGVVSTRGFFPLVLEEQTV